MDGTLSIHFPTDRRAQKARQVVEQLQKHQFEAYLAGGSVRDLLLGRKPKDYDIATSARPEDVERLFPTIVPIGRKFGILLVIWEGQAFEVATFRGEHTYSDKRRPDEVYWTTAQEDAGRRDFTINAFFYNPNQGQVFDFVHGQADLEAGLIRFVGNPDQRVQEDPLRILRAIRLKNSLGFQYEAETYRALTRHAGLLIHVSAERILEELNRMWADSSRAESLAELAELGLLAQILPEINNLRGLPQPTQFHREGDVFDHTVRAVASLPKRVPTFLVWAVLYHDAGKAKTITYPASSGERIRYDHHKTVGAELARQVGVRLAMPRVEIETIAWLVDHHMDLMGLETLREAKRRTFLLDPRFKWLLELHRADASGTLPRDLSLYREVRTFYQKYRALWKVEQKNGPPRMFLSGHDLREELRIEAGPDLGRILDQLREAQLERKITTRQEALALAQQLIRKTKP